MAVLGLLSACAYLDGSALFFVLRSIVGRIEFFGPSFNRVAYSADVVEAPEKSKVEKWRLSPLISARSSCHSSLGILRKTSTTFGSN
jgi:hypothetical protein